MEKIQDYIFTFLCDKICNYCDFTAFQGANSKVLEYVVSLKKEIWLKGQKDFLIDSIFISGGTPSFILGEYIFEILEEMKKIFVMF